MLSLRLHQNSTDHSSNSTDPDKAKKVVIRQEGAFLGDADSDDQLINYRLPTRQSPLTTTSTKKRETVKSQTLKVKVIGRSTTASPEEIDDTIDETEVEASTMDYQVDEDKKDVPTSKSPETTKRRQAVTSKRWSATKASAENLDLAGQNSASQTGGLPNSAIPSVNENSNLG
jgi:hypothetical protein